MNRIIRAYDSDPNYDLVPLCPQCRARIYWRGYGIGPGEAGTATCSRSPKSTQIMFDPETAYMCTWEGIAKRNDDGTVTVYGHDGSRVPYRIIKRGL